MYELLRPILFAGDPEKIHDRVLAGLEVFGDGPRGRSLISWFAGRVTPSPVQTMGLKFDHPLGLAAGFDKDARVLPALFALNFAYVEIGTVTPRPQTGNPKPRMWRFPEAQALVNAMGFPGEGMLSVKKRLIRCRERELLSRPVGINIGKNAATALDNAGEDYQSVLRELLEFGDYFVVNVSSPNTPGLRTLQQPDSLRSLLAPLMQISKSAKPLLLKVAPDLADDDLVTAASVVRELGMAGIVCANTSIRREQVSRAASLDRGGLSGNPVFSRMIECVKIVRRELPNESTVIAVGGIGSKDRVRQSLAAGANLLQIYTPFIYLGPRVVKKLLG